MLLNGHQLKRVVACVNDPGQHLLPELNVGSHTRPFLPHTHMAFVNDRRSGSDIRRCVLPNILLGLPHLGTENKRAEILNHASAIGGNAVPFPAIPADFQPVVRVVLKRIRRQLQLPIASRVQPCAGEFRKLVPATVIANKVDGSRVGGPLTKDPAFVGVMKPVIEMSVGKRNQRTVGPQPLNGGLKLLSTALQVRLKRTQPRVIAKLCSGRRPHQTASGLKRGRSSMSS